MSGTIPGLVVLGSIRKQAEQARGSNPVRSIPPWPLHQLLLPELLEFSDQEASWGGKGLFSLHFHVAVHHQGKSGLELKQVRKQELMQRPWRDVLYWHIHIYIYIYPPKGWRDGSMMNCIYHSFRGLIFGS